MMKIAVILGSILLISQLTTQAYAMNITAFIHFNEEAIKQDNHGGDLHDVWFTVDGKNYSNMYYDMSDAVYGSDPEIEDNLFTDGLTKELMVADNASEICLQDRSGEPEYKSCSYIRTSVCSMVACNQVISNIAEVHFTYPASWEIELEAT